MFVKIPWIAINVLHWQLPFRVCHNIFRFFQIRRRIYLCLRRYDFMHMDVKSRWTRTQWLLQSMPVQCCSAGHAAPGLYNVIGVYTLTGVISDKTLVLSARQEALSYGSMQVTEFMTCLYSTARACIYDLLVLSVFCVLGFSHMRKCRWAYLNLAKNLTCQYKTLHCMYIDFRLSPGAIFSQRPIAIYCNCSHRYSC